MTTTPPSVRFPLYLHSDFKNFRIATRIIVHSSRRAESNNLENLHSIINIFFLQIDDVDVFSYMRKRRIISWIFESKMQKSLHHISFKHPYFKNGLRGCMCMRWPSVKTSRRLFRTNSAASVPEPFNTISVWAGSPLLFLTYLLYYKFQFKIFPHR